MGKILQAFGHSVALRTAILVVLATTLVMGTVGFLQIRRVRAELSKDTERQTSKAMDAAIMKIDSRVSNVETAVKTAAAYTYKVATEEEGAYRMMERLLLSNEDISAVTLLYRDSYFASHGRYFAPTVYRDMDNTGVVRDEIGGPENDFCYLENDSSWVYTCKLDSAYWCLPYVDSISTKRPMVTFSVPLHEADGSIYAVLCADVDLHWVENLVSSVKPYDYSIVSVLSRDGKFICHPDSQAVMTINALSYARQVEDPIYLDITQRMLRWVRGSDTMVVRPEFIKNETKSQEFVVYYAPVDRVKWSVSYTLPVANVMEKPNRIRNWMVVVLLLTVAFIALVCYLLIKAQLKPMKALAHSIKAVSRGDFSKPLVVIKTKDEIRQFRDAFENMQHSLAAYVEELKTTTATKAGMESELSIAHDIQMAMIPKIFPPFPERDDIQLFASLTPAKAVGGDLYDFFIRDEKLFFIIGDVSGKGVPASLVMAVTRSLFRTLAANESRPQKIVAAINNAIAVNNENCMFVTLLVGVLDLPTGRLRYCNAGHDAPFITGVDKAVQMETVTNLPVGLVVDYDYQPCECVLKTGQGLFLFTDGLTEAENEAKELYGSDRLTALMQVVNRQTPREQVNAALEAVRQHADGAEQSDDLTLLALKYTHHEKEVQVRHHLTLKNKVEELAQLAPFVSTLAKEAGLDETLHSQVDLALDEAVSNVVMYAYEEGAEGTIDIEAMANTEKIKIVITDSGRPFDPTTARDPDITLPVEERPVGGLGIFLVRQVMDSVNYERTDGKNVLTLRKKI